MSTLVCPHCQAELPLKDARPGRFATRCGKCGKPFALVIQGMDELGPRGTTQLEEKPPEGIPLGMVQSPEAAITVDPADAPWPWIPPKPPRLGGYVVGEVLGHGRVGTVYRVRRRGLTGGASLKVIRSDWTADPIFTARLMRDLYAAAQIRHPNLLRIDQAGERDGTVFVLREYVDGMSLAELLKEKEKLKPKDAAGLVLQAARGLRHAHQQGMIHRDVKLETLLLGRDGGVKVTDLGMGTSPALAQAQDREEPLPGTKDPKGEPRTPTEPPGPVRWPASKLGTPGFTAPELYRDASRVDGRADQYALGCVLRALLTGQAEPNGGGDVPRELGEIMARMTAARAEDRYPDLDPVVRGLEGFLGVNAAEVPAQAREAVGEIQQAATDFAARLEGDWRTYVPIGYAVITLLAGLFLATGWWRLGTLLGATVAGGLGFGVIRNARRQRSPILDRLSELVVTSRRGDVLIGLAGLALVLMALWLMGLFGVVLMGAVLGMAGAFALERIADPKLGSRQGEAAALGRKGVRTLRRSGMSETALWSTVRQTAGEGADAFCEALTGYDAMRWSRLMCGGEAARPWWQRGLPLREILLDALDGRLRERGDARDVELLRGSKRSGSAREG